MHSIIIILSTNSFTTWNRLLHLNTSFSFFFTYQKKKAYESLLGAKQLSMCTLTWWNKIKYVYFYSVKQNRIKNRKKIYLHILDETKPNMCPLLDKKQSNKWWETKKTHIFSRIILIKNASVICSLFMSPSLIFFSICLSLIN